MITHAEAERLRTMLSEIQLAVLEDMDVPPELAAPIVRLLSERGFRLVDELEGVVR